MKEIKSNYSEMSSEDLAFECARIKSEKDMV